jgi:hypothetical protein
MKDKPTFEFLNVNGCLLLVLEQGMEEGVDQIWTQEARPFINYCRLLPWPNKIFLILAVFFAGLWIRIDLMRIRIQFRIQGFDD